MDDQINRAPEFDDTVEGIRMRLVFLPPSAVQLSPRFRRVHAAMNAARALPGAYGVNRARAFKSAIAPDVPEIGVPAAAVASALRLGHDGP